MSEMVVQLNGQSCQTVSENIALFSVLTNLLTPSSQGEAVSRVHRSRFDHELHRRHWSCYSGTSAHWQAWATFEQQRLCLQASRKLAFTCCAGAEEPPGPVGMHLEAQEQEQES